MGGKGTTNKEKANKQYHKITLLSTQEAMSLEKTTFNQWSHIGSPFYIIIATISLR